VRIFHADCGHNVSIYDIDVIDDNAYKYKGRTYCAQCFAEAVVEDLQDEPEKLAQLVGAEVFDWRDLDPEDYDIEEGDYDRLSL
jgi:hypothetical protein